MPLASLIAMLAETTPDRADLDSRDPGKRLAAFGKLKTKMPLDELLPHIAPLARSGNPGVRLAVAQALRGLDVNQTVPILADVAMGYQPGELEYLNAFASAIRSNEGPVYAYLLGKLGQPPLKWSEQFADIAARLHPTDSLFALRDRAMSPDLPADRRLQVIEALEQIQDKLAGAAMLEIATKGPFDLRFQAQEIVQRNRLWQDPSRPSVGIALPEKPVFKSKVLRKGSVAIDVDITGARKLFLVASDSGDGNSCDWADWIDPVLVSSSGATPLTDLKWSASHTGWGDLHLNRNCKGTPLKVGGKEFAHGIGGHAPMVLAYDIAGKGFVRFKATAGVDNGGPGLGGSDYIPQTASVQFLVFIEK